MSALPQWRVLMVDDDEDDYILTADMTRQFQGRKVSLEWAASYPEGMRMLWDETYDAALIDYDLGDHTGIQLIRELTSRSYPIPLILFTGRGSYEVDLEAMDAGATLYITKSDARPLMLERSIRYAIERKRIEQERMQILESIQDGFIALDREWRIIFVNRVAAKTAWYDPGELTGCNFWQMFPRVIGTPAERYYRLAMDERRPVRFEMAGVYQNLYYTVSIYPFQDGISVYWQDITERKRAEEALAAKQAILQAVLDTTKESIWMFDPAGIILLANQTALARIHKHQDQAVGRHFKEFLSPELARARQAYIDQVVRTKQPLEFEDLREDIRMWFHHSFYPVLDDTGQVTGITSYSRDITASKLAEAKARSG